MATKFGPKNCTHQSLQEIGKFIACTVEISGLINFNTLSEFLREPRELPWQPNLNKNKPKLHWFQSCARNRGIFARKFRILGRRLQICYHNFQRNQWSCHGNQIWTKISQNCTDFSSVQEIEKLFAWKVRILSWQPNSGTNFCFLQKKSRNFLHVQSGFVGFNSNVLPEFSRELLWPPNLGKNKPKLHKFQFLARNLKNLSM